MAFDGDTSFLFEVHIIKHLSVRGFDGFCYFQKSIGQGTLTMVNMRNDTKVSYIFHSVI
jgi:hypothetical protein